MVVEPFTVDRAIEPRHVDLAVEDSTSLVYTNAAWRCRDGEDENVKQQQHLSSSFLGRILK
jgi:hypothetical protein